MRSLDASLDIEGEPSRAVHGEGHGSGEDPGGAAARDSSAYEGAERSEGGGGNWGGLPGPSALRTAWKPPSYNRCGAGKDRKSTRLNSSHTVISYAVFCLKKKTTT